VNCVKANSVTAFCCFVVNNIADSAITVKLSVALPVSGCCYELGIDAASGVEWDDWVPLDGKDIQDG
jgi:hypothetical protein